MKPGKATLWILILFSLSVLVRVPTLNRPLSKHHEFTTAFVLRIMQIWEEDGLLKHHAAPIMNYPGEANKFINNQTLGEFDKEGNDYYQSYPPFAYLFPYLIFKTLGTHPNVLPLEIFNMLLHLAEAFLIYYIVCLLFGYREKGLAFLPAIMAVALHLFNACALWFHSNSYMTDMPAVTWWLLATFIFLRMREKGKLSSPGWLLGLFAANFCLNYTEYLGVTFTVMLGLYCLWNARKNGRYLLIGTVLGVSCIAALGLTAWQYSHINGWEALWHVVTYRYGVRGAGGSATTLLSEWMMIGKNYIIGFLPALILLLIFLMLYVRKEGVKKLSGLRSVAFFLFGPVLLHHFIFLNASLYDFQVLKSSPFIALLCAWVIYQLMNRQGLATTNTVVAVLLTAVFSTGMYYYINRPGEFSGTGERYDEFKTGGAIIRDLANADEVVFIMNVQDEPQLVYYARRNLRTIANEEEAYHFLEKHGRQKGVIFTADKSTIKRIERRK